jgi:cell division protein FtsB
MEVSLMAGKKFFRPVRVVFRRSSTTLKIFLIAALLISTVTLLTLRGMLLSEQKKAEALRQQAIALEQENEKLTRRNAMLGSVESVKELATELLGLVDPDTVIFDPVE